MGSPTPSWTDQIDLERRLGLDPLENAIRGLGRLPDFYRKSSGSYAAKIRTASECGEVWLCLDLHRENFRQMAFR